MSRRALSLALQVEQLEDRMNPAGSVIPAGEFGWMQYSPTGELGQLLWDGSTLVYRARVAGGWQAQAVASASTYTAGQYDATAAVQKASQTAQLVFTSDGTPHALFLDKVWNGGAGKFQTLIRHYARTSAGWQDAGSIVPNWLTTWGPNNLVAAAGQNNTIHLIFTETTAAATGVGNFGSGHLMYATSAGSGWSFAKIADTADLSQDVWFIGGRWAPRFLSIAVDSGNAAHVTYTPQFYIAGAFSTVNSTLMYATNRGGSWASQAVMGPQDGTADAGLGASVAVAPNGQVAVASYYVDRYNTGSPQTSQLMYHALTPGGWTHQVVATTPDGYVAGDGPHFTGFAPQLSFNAASQPTIVFSDEAGEHLPVTYANQFAGQIRVATNTGAGWAIQTVFRQANPVVNQLFYPVAAVRDGQVTYAGLQATSAPDSNGNPLRTDFAVIDVNAPYGATTTPVSTAAPLPSPGGGGGGGTKWTGAPVVPTTSPAGWAVATDAGTNAGQVYGFRPDGSVAISATPFGAGYRGGVRIARGDINGDGVMDLITATGPGIAARVRVWDGVSGAMIADFDPFPGYQGGLWVAAGDVNADGHADIAVGTELGKEPHVKLFSGNGGGELASFYAYAPGFLGGVRVALGDLNRDGYADLVTAAGYGAGPHVVMFDGKAFATGQGPVRLAGDFYFFAPDMTAGLHIAVGDVDGDGYADIIGAPGGGAAHIKVVSGRALSTGQGPTELVSMLAWEGNTTGMRVAAVDADGDGLIDVVTAPTGANNGRIGVLSAASLLSNNTGGITWLDPLPGLTTGVFVG